MKKTLTVIITSLLVVVGLLSINKTDDGCINLYVDYSSLDNGTKIT
jgi:hypothetical protein